MPKCLSACVLKCCCGTRCGASAPTLRLGIGVGDWDWSVFQHPAKRSVASADSGDRSMKTWVRAGLLGGVWVVAALVGQARQDAQKFGATTTAVVIDVVVRDAKGRPVTDLTRADFELLEDGVPQKLGDVTRVGAPAVAQRRGRRRRWRRAEPPPRPSPRHDKSPRRPFSRSSSIASRPKRARWRTRARWRRSRPVRPTTLSACSCRTCRWCRSRPTPRTARSCARRLTRRHRARRRSLTGTPSRAQRN